ncbi:MAG: hypothetical protein ABW328_10725 [Ilumatobacteraceae bacterium]
MKPDHSSLVSARLDREWRTISHRTRIVATVRSWEVTDVPFDDLDELLALAGYRVPLSTESNDVLLRIVQRAATDDLAARIVLQRILPGLLSQVSRRRAFGDRDSGFEELLGAAWLAIRSARIDHRPEQVAANIVRDAGYRAFVAPARRKSATEVAVDPRTLDETPSVVRVSACEELAGILADARAGGFPPTDLDLVRHLLQVGSPATVARERKITTRTVRNRRDRITARLRRHCEAA